MTFEDFARYHSPALGADEVRFNVQISVVNGALKAFPDGFQYWTLGSPGHCAIRSPDRSILLGALSPDECRKLARETRDLAYPGVIGSDGTAGAFVEEAALLGINFPEIIRQRIHVLRVTPRYPGAEGVPRVVTPADTELLFEWMLQFHREAVPEDPKPRRENMEKAAASGRWMFWTVGGKPVSLAAIVRELRTVAAIGAVFTPSQHRGRGYAGSVTAAVCERIFSGGKKAACLYTDLENPYSNRCYENVGFTPYCDSLHYLRSRPTPSSTRQSRNTRPSE